MIRKLLLPVLCVAALGGCVTPGYQAGGYGGGDYYYGQPSNGYYDGSGYGYGDSYGYGGYGGYGYDAGYGGYGYGGYPYYYRRPVVINYPRGHHRGDGHDHGEHDHDGKGHHDGDGRDHDGRDHDGRDRDDRDGRPPWRDWRGNNRGEQGRDPRPGGSRPLMRAPGQRADMARPDAPSRQFQSRPQIQQRPAMPRVQRSTPRSAPARPANRPERDGRLERRR